MGVTPEATHESVQKNGTEKRNRTDESTTQLNIIPVDDAAVDRLLNLPTDITPYLPPIPTTLDIPFLNIRLFSTGTKTLVTPLTGTLVTHVREIYEGNAELHTLGERTATVLQDRLRLDRRKRMGDEVSDAEKKRIRQERNRERSLLLRRWHKRRLRDLEMCCGRLGVCNGLLVELIGCLVRGVKEGFGEGGELGDYDGVCGRMMQHKDSNVICADSEG